MPRTSTYPAMQSHVELHAQALLFSFLGLDGRDVFKPVHGALLSAYLSMSKALAPGATVEIGAHEARYSRSVRRALPAETPVIAFEANPDVHAQHAPALTAGGVDYRNLAVSDSVGTLRFRVPVVRGQEARTMGSLRDFGGMTEHVEYQVPSIRLDDLGLQRAMLWIDVEGATGEVLAGAEETLRTVLAAFIEVEEDERWPGQMTAAEVIDHFADRGFVGLLRDTQRNWQYNVIFVRRELIFDHRIAPFRTRYFAELRRLAGLTPAATATES